MGLASTGFSNQSYFLDYDKDGDLDMLLLNHNPKNLPIQNVEALAKLLKQDNPEKGSGLFKQTNGKFEDVTRSSGINGSELSYGLGLVFPISMKMDGPTSIYPMIMQCLIIYISIIRMELLPMNSKTALAIPASFLWAMMWLI